ncbi:MAG: inositol monophosphatase [Proteobacteria bacterium]|nr:inositol monophosphatase [Pseudomonadota bacterium]
MAHRSALINVMVSAVFKAARGLNRDFGEVEQLQVSRKGPADFVSTADTKAERTLFQELSRARPEVGFLMEERGAIEGKDKTKRWIVDPLDGTTNYLHGLPHWAVSVGFEERGEIMAAVIYDPAKDEMFWSEKGRGAYVDDKRLRVSSRQNLNESLLATGIPWQGRGGHAESQAEIAAFAPRVAGIRRYGAASLDLAYVAAGRFDGFWEDGLSAWDIAAGILLVREAGGMITEIDQGSRMLETGSVLATNTNLHDDMARVIREARKELKSKS